MLVEGDPVRLRQVLLNLAANAVKFTNNGYVSIRVSSGNRSSALVELHFSVEDTGIGIPKQEQEKIFEAFSQADNSVTRRFGGTGLGLAICSQLVHLMGGRIEVESAPGLGSKFRFSCRFGTPEGEPVPAPDSLDSPTVPLHVLLAEDNLVNQTVIMRMLERQGHRVRVVDNGRQAIEAVLNERFDLVLMDNQMPECSGIETTRVIPKARLSYSDHCAVRRGPQRRSGTLSRGGHGRVSIDAVRREGSPGGCGWNFQRQSRHDTRLNPRPPQIIPRRRVAAISTMASDRAK